MPTLRLACLALALGVALAAPAAAQPDADTSATGVLRLADAYLRAGQTEQAVALLEDLLAAAPRSYPAYAKLREAYTAAGRLDDVVALVDRRIAAEGPTASLLAERGAALYGAGREADAEAAWAQALAAEPEAEFTYRLVANALGEQRLYARAAEILAEGRARLGPPTLFAAELAALYGLAADPAAAADEWLALLAENPGAGALVQSRLARLLEAPPPDDRPLEGPSGAPAPLEAVTAAVDRAVRRDPLSRPFRVLSAWLALERGDYRAALDANVAIDRLQGEEGQSLVAFAEAAVAAGALEEAGRALALVLERHPTGPAAPLARFAQAALTERLAAQRGERATDDAGQPAPAPGFTAARDGYLAFAREHPAHPRAAEALRRAAGLARDVFRDEAEAGRLLREAAARPGLSDEERTGLDLDLARLALRQGALGDARDLFTQVEEAERIGPAAEAARLELAYLDFYTGDLAGALVRAEAMDDNTATDAANDAIALKLLLRENQGPDSTGRTLRHFARASLLARQDRHGEALAALDSLLAGAAAAEAPVADDAAFLRARVLRAGGRTDDALAAFEAFPRAHPASYLVERARFLLAETIERDGGNVEAARAAYDAFLQEHPRSLLASEARARLRRLRPAG